MSSTRFAVALVSVLAGVSVVGVLAGASMVAADPQPLALEGQPAPLAEYTYSAFAAVDVSDDTARAISVITTLVSKTAFPRRISCVVTLTSAGSGTVQACAGNPVPGGGTLRSLNHLGVSPAGEVVYDARVKGGAHGIFTGALVPVARAREPFPGGGIMGAVNYPVATRTQGTVFKAYLS